MKTFFRVAVLSVVLNICPAFASGDGCDGILQAPPIQRTAQPTYLIEMESAGQIIEPDKMIPPLGTGFYSFLILSSGEVLLAPKYDVRQFMESGKGLATHKSLLHMYEEKMVESPADRVVAGGEFQVAFGLVIDISNRSGNFRGDSERLDGSIRWLKARGLKLSAAVKIRAIDPLRDEDRGHTPIDRNFDEFHLDTMAVVERSPEGAHLRELYLRFHELIGETFPGTPGREAIAKILQFRNKGARETGEQRGAAAFYYPLMTAYSRDGFEFGLKALLREEVISEFRRDGEGYTETVPAQIQNVLTGAGAMIGPDLKQKWLALAEAFATAKGP